MGFPLSESDLEDEEDRIEAIEILRKRVYRGTATVDDEHLFTKLAKRDASSLPRETPEQRKRRLQKERCRSAARRRNETEEQRRRRLAANRIRNKLRRLDYKAEVTEEGTKQLYAELHALPGYVDKGWKKETAKEWERRLDMDVERHRKRAIARQLESDLATAEKMVLAMQEWQEYEQGIASFLSRLPDSPIGEYRKSALIQNATRYQKTAQGMLFCIDTALSAFETKHSLSPLKRRRAKWMITPPKDNEPHEKVARVMLIKLEMRPKKNWSFPYACEIVFEWKPEANSAAGEWVPSPEKNYEFSETGYVIKSFSLPFGYESMRFPRFGELIIQRVRDQYSKKMIHEDDPLCCGPRSHEIEDLARKEEELQNVNH